MDAVQTTPIVEKAGLITTTAFDEFMARPENAERRFELIEGEIVEKVTNPKHGLIGGVLVGELRIYLKQHKIGRVGFEINHKLNTVNEYLPDVSVELDLSADYVELPKILKAPDLAVEIKSPSNTLRQLRIKARHYLEHGGKLVWIVIPDKQIVEVYTLEDDWVLNASDSLEGGAVLPGFTLAVKDIFDV